jgi:hypothetical protein
VTAPRVLDDRLDGDWPLGADTLTSLFVRGCAGCGAVDHTSAFGRRARDGAACWSCPRCGIADVEWLEVLVP